MGVGVRGYHLNVLLCDETQFVLHTSEGVGQLLILVSQSPVLIQYRLILTLSLPQSLQLQTHTHTHTQTQNIISIYPLLHKQYCH